MGIRVGLPELEMASGSPCLLFDFFVIEEYKKFSAPEETLVKP